MKLLKLKYELDSLDFKTQLLGVKIQNNDFKIEKLGADLHAFGLELKKAKEG